MTHIRINDRIEPVDLVPGTPVRVRWWPTPDATAWRVTVTDRPDAETPLWRSGLLTADASATIENLVTAPSARYWLTVESMDDDGNASTSVPVTFGTAPAADGWAATPIWANPAAATATAAGARNPADPANGADPTDAHAPAADDARTDAVPAPTFSGLDETASDAGDAFFQRPVIKQTEHNGLGWAFLHGEFDVPNEPVLWATLHLTAASVKPGRQFVYRAWLNGVFVGLGPTFPTANEARTDGFDVTGLIRPGARNAIGVVAWTLEDRRFLAQLDLGLADGRVLHLGTGERAATNAISWTGIVGNAAYPDSLSTGTQYCESPAEDLQAQHYPFDLSEPGACEDWPAAVRRDPFATLAPNPADKVTVRYEPVSSATAIGRGRVVLDFGRAWMGGIRLDADAIDAIRPAADASGPNTAGASGPDAGGTAVDVRIRYGEVLNPDGTVKYQLSAFNTYEETWHIPAVAYTASDPAHPIADPARSGTEKPDGTDGAESHGHAIESWGLKVFRYVELIGADDPASQAMVERIAAHPETVSAAAIVYPFDPDAAGFTSSDATLNRVWRLCRNTIEAFNGPIYADSWTRERAAYEADAWLQWRAHLTLDDSPSVGAYSVDYLVANRTWPTEWPLYLILAVHDAWMATGSLDQAHRDYARLQGLLPDRYLDESSGFVVKDPGDSSVMDGDLVDWPPAERDGFTFGRVNTVINALASQAYADMADLAGALGRADDSRHYADVAARMRRAINERLFDDFQGAYLDGLDTGASGRPINHASEHASAFALAFADVPADRLRRIGTFLEAKGMACSVYTAAILLDGLYRAGFGDVANRLVASHERPRSWWNMIRSGAGGTSEGWDVSIKGNTTYSHPWAASPAFLLPQGLLGVRPLKPGYREFLVAPQLGGVREASTQVPTPSGVVRVHARRNADGTTAVDVTVPACTTAVVEVNGVRTTVAGPAHVSL